MAELVFSNNASALLAASIDEDDTSIQVASGFGDLFPSPGSGEYFIVVLRNAAGAYEVCHCTARAGDLLTVERAKEGTSGQSWTNNQTRVELRATKGTYEAFIQRAGDTMAGDLDMDGNDVVDAVLSGSGTKITDGQIIGVPLRGAEDDDSNEIVVPNDGGAPTIGGAVILTEGNGARALPVGSIIMWFGSLVNIPDGWALCDGTGGTPDMRGLMPIGAGGSVALGQAVGSATSTTTSSGSHNHGGATQSHALTEAQIPPHKHLSNATKLLESSPNGSVDTNGATQWEFHDFRTLANPYTSTVGGGAGHSHGLSSDGAHTHTVAVAPPARGLYFIMRVS